MWASEWRERRGGFVTLRELSHGGNKNPLEENNSDDASEKKTTPYYPKRGQTVELVCESLGFKGKGICKVDGTGFVVMCDRALPGERFLGRVTRRKGSYAEVSLKISPFFCNKVAIFLFVIAYCCCLGDKDQDFNSTP